MAEHPDIADLEALRSGEGRQEDARHAEGCAECRETLEALALLANLLGGREPGAPAIPAQIDQRILWHAGKRALAARRRPMSSRQRWTSTAAAAALLIAAFSMWSLDGRAPRQHVSSEVVRTAGRDLNRDGRVDVLDVFALARAVESRSNSAATDVNGDGVTDRRDVDAIASQAVALGHA